MDSGESIAHSQPVDLALEKKFIVHPLIQFDPYLDIARCCHSLFLVVGLVGVIFLFCMNYFYNQKRKCWSVILTESLIDLRNGKSKCHLWSGL